jgi:hypothetical protein
MKSGSQILAERGHAGYLAYVEGVCRAKRQRRVREHALLPTPMRARYECAMWREAFALLNRYRLRWASYRRTLRLAREAQQTINHCRSIHELI